MKSVFTVYLEGPYWVGVLERTDSDGLWLGKHIFGGEPTNAELWQFAFAEFAQMRVELIPATASFETERPIRVKKSLQKAKKDQQRGVDSSTHVAMQAQFAKNKEERKTERKKKDDARATMLYALKKEQRKARHRGR